MSNLIRSEIAGGTIIIPSESRMLATTSSISKGQKDDKANRERDAQFVENEGRRKFQNHRHVFGGLRQRRIGNGVNRRDVVCGGFAPA